VPTRSTRASWDGGTLIDTANRYTNGTAESILGDLEPGARSSVEAGPSNQPEAQMTKALAGRGDRVLGRSLLTLANVITVAAPLAADWNDSHIFNPRWPAHARFHGVTALAMSTTLSAANIWSVWSGSDQTRARFFAAAVPVAYWTPFFLAPLVPGTAVDDPPNPVQRVAGVPISLLGAAATTATATAGWFIDRRSARLRAG
jgi:Family of unknown function (DUF6640)